jgi:hypothetical protein
VALLDDGGSPSRGQHAAPPTVATPS